MIEQEMRIAIQKLHDEGHGIKKINAALHISRNTVRRVIRGDRGEATSPSRQERKMLTYLDQTRELYSRCQGNMVRVFEELIASGVEVSYSTLTRFCREQGISEQDKKCVGEYYFGPGEEMQHDTSPHRVIIDGKERKVQCASVVLCFSRMLYAQVYPTFNRFYCKAFLTEALKYFNGAAKRCMVDNTNIVVLRGTGKQAVITDEMERFAERFGFEFEAHEKGDANRSGRVERPFHYIEHNFYAGREFKNLQDLNQQLLEWCNTANNRYRDRLKAKPIELYQTEKHSLKPLPIYIPEVIDIVERLVDTEGYVNLHSNRYSVPEEYVGRQVEVWETLSKVLVYLRHQCIATHERREEGVKHRVTLPEHRKRRGRQGEPKELPLSPEEQALRRIELFGLFVDELKKRYQGNSRTAIRRLYRFYIDYPTEPMLEAIRVALEYGLLDLDRIERLILKTVRSEYFQLPMIYQPSTGENYGNKIEGTDGRESDTTPHDPETPEDSGNNTGGT